MSETVLVTIIGGAVTLALGAQAIILPVLVNYFVKRVKAMQADVAETKHHIVNDHGDRNFRDENDGRHAETLRLFAEQDKKLDVVIGTSKNHEDLLGWLVNDVVKVQRDLDEHIDETTDRSNRKG